MSVLLDVENAHVVCTDCAPLFLVSPGEANCGEHAVLSLSVPRTSKAVAFKG